MHGEYCYLSGTKSIKDGKVDFCIIVSFNKPDEALEYYAKRWQIDTLFRALKTSGFNLEDTCYSQRKTREINYACDDRFCMVLQNWGLYRCSNQKNTNQKTWKKSHICI